MGVEEQIGDTVKLALQKYWTFFGVAGLALIIFAAGDGFPKWLVQLSPAWQITTFIVGCVFEAACFAVVVTEMRGESVKRPAELADIGVLITRPDDNEEVSAPMRAAGTLTRLLPAGYQLWIFGCAGQAPASYWPQRCANVSGTSWSCEIPRTWTAGNEGEYVLMIVGSNGQSLIQLYWQLNLKAQNDSGKWAGALERLTDDMKLCTTPRTVRWR